MSRYPYPEDDGELGLPQYGMTYGGYQPSPAPSYTPQAQTAQPQTPQNSWLGPAGLALDVVGTGLNAYGAYKQGKQADKQYNLEKEEFNFDKAISLEDRQRAEEERRRRADLEAANYAGSYQNNAIQGYGGYNAMTGR